VPNSKKTENVPEHVGRQMRKWRKVKGMTLLQVAEKIGCTKGHLSAAENGKGNLSLPLFLAYCETIGAPSSKVLEERLLAKHRDVDRLTADLVQSVGSRELLWLTSLERTEYKLAMERAHEAVEYHRAQVRSRRQLAEAAES